MNSSHISRLRSMSRVMVACLLLIGLAPLSAAASDVASLEISPTLYGTFGGSLDSSEVAFEELDIDEERSFGGTVDFKITRNLAFEIFYSNVETALEFDFFGGTDRLADLDLTYLHGGILWQASQGQVRPFGVLSAGVTQVDIKAPGFGEDDRFSIGVGGGVKILFNEHLGLRFEGRILATELPGQSNTFDYCCGGYEDSSLTQFFAGAGIIIGF